MVQSQRLRAQVGVFVEVGSGKLVAKLYPYREKRLVVLNSYRRSFLMSSASRELPPCWVVPSGCSQREVSG